jgi:hypothetical protein
MATWELYDGKAQIGPLEEDHVIRMIAAGMPANTMIRQTGSEDWKGLRSHAPFAMAIEQAQGSSLVSPGFPAPREPQPSYHAPPPQVVVQQTSGCSTAFWFIILLFVIIPAMGFMSCVVCAAAGKH